MHGMHACMHVGVQASAVHRGPLAVGPRKNRAEHCSRAHTAAPLLLTGASPRNMAEFCNEDAFIIRRGMERRLQQKKSRLKQTI